MSNSPIAKTTTISSVLGTQKSIVQRLTALTRTTNSIRVQLAGSYPKAPAGDEVGVGVDNVVTALSLTQSDMYSIIEELERDLSSISEYIGDAYNPDAVQPEFGG